MKRAHNPFVAVKKWRTLRLSHRHREGRWRARTSTEHVAAAPAAGATVYRVETYIPFQQPTPLHRDVYYVPAGKLDEFFNGWGEHATIVVDACKRFAMAEALEELRAFRSAVEGRPATAALSPSPAVLPR